MSKVTFHGQTLTVDGSLPKTGSLAPAFTLTTGELKDVTLASYAGKRKVLNIVPSLDTPVCATSTRKFNEKAASLKNTVVLVVSADLPFAAGRFCTTEGLKNVVALSTFRHGDFRKAWGVALSDGPLAGLCARAVIVLDEHDKVLHAELVGKIEDEPDYAAALKALA